MRRTPTSTARLRGRRKPKGSGKSRGKLDPVTAYAKDVLADKIVAGELVKHACDRHLKDLRDGPKRGIFWSPERAAHALNFYPSVLSVTAGAMAGRPFNLLPWHTFCTGSLFGWYRSNGLRRFRRSWAETGKGQAKSPWMAATGLYVLGFCGIPRAEVYAIAEDKDQANVLFKDAVAMCRADIPGEDEGVTLETRDTVIIRGVGDNAWKIEHPLSGSKFQSLANSGAISGPRPAAILADEIHEFKSDEQIEMWQAALAKMAGDPLMMLGTNTPASNQIVGTAYSDIFSAS
jgi:phage terminase large subunit-like protein